MNTRQPFEALGLPVTWSLTHEAITQAYRRVMAACHPDRFLQAPEHLAQQAMQQSQDAAQAQQQLKDPYGRACACYQVWWDKPLALPAPDHGFLARHMDHQEALAAIHDLSSWQQAAQRLKEQEAQWHDQAHMLFVPETSEALFLAHLAQSPYLARLHESLQQRKPS